MATGPTATSIDAYVAAFPPETQKVLAELRDLAKATAPGVTEKISYAIPTFELNGQYLVYFAAWKKHIGFYPITGTVAAAFADEIKPYKRRKGSGPFPLAQPMPTDLIRRIVEFRVGEVTAMHS
jgi:uncharacterized protein YdhG (YjbR/CyaY superfamily)